MFSQAIRDYLLHREDTGNVDLLHANDLAAGDTNNFMGAIREGDNRQGMLSDIALRSLAENNHFNQFLATYGLDRDRTLYELANGQNTGLTNLLQQFLMGANISAQGHI